MYFLKIFAFLDNNQYLPRTPAVSYSSNSDPVSFTRTICGGLILPTIATLFGKVLFKRVNSNFQRSIIGGIAFIGLKGILKIYYKQQQFLRQAHRQIKNYDETPTKSRVLPNRQLNQNLVNRHSRHLSPFTSEDESNNVNQSFDTNRARTSSWSNEEYN